MMRYVLYDSGREIISLNKDIQFIQNYIGLMRIRYTNDVDIRVEYPHDLPTQVSIPPLLLIVFVENAFKHGVSYNNPSFIHMRSITPTARSPARSATAATRRKAKDTAPESDWTMSASVWN